MEHNYFNLGDVILKLLKILLVIHFLSCNILAFCFPILYSFSILPRKESIYHLIFLIPPLIYIFFPLNGKLSSKKIICSKILASIIYLFIYFNIPINNFWGILCIVCITTSILYLYFPIKINKNIYLKYFFRLILCIFFIGMSIFNLIIPSTIFITQFREANQSYISYINIIPIIKYAIITKDGYDEKISPYMSEEIFKKLNQKTQYPELDHFSTIELTELHQKQDENDSRIIYVDIRYIKSLEDKHNNHISGGQGYQQFTVLIKNNVWYIINLVEPLVDYQFWE